MTKSELSRILLLSACTGLAGCSTDSARFGDFYADALPTRADAANIDMRTTASVPPGSVGTQGGVPLPVASMQGVAPSYPSGPLGAPTASGRTAGIAPAAPWNANSPATTNQAVASRSLTPLPMPGTTGPNGSYDAVDRNPVPLPPQAPSTTPQANGMSIAERVRAALPKVSRKSAEPAPATAAKRIPALDRVVTAVKTPTAKGWSSGSTSGSSVVVREGETLYNLSKRFGIPVASIMSANGITDVRSVAAGRTLTIPTYNYSTEAPISAPDANPDVRAARGARGMKGEPLTASVPAPNVRGSYSTAAMTQQPIEPSPVAAAAIVQPRDLSLSDAASVAVKPGDTLYRIASRAGTSVSALRAANSLSSDSIRVGQVLYIPRGAATSPVRAEPKPVEPAAAATATPPPAPTPVQVASVEPQSLPRTNPQPEPAVVSQPSAPAQTAATTSPKSGAASDGMRWPINGRLVRDFGGSSKGIDISAPKGSPIRAAEGGKVLYAGSGLKELGKTVLVQHDSGLVTVYGYADDLRVAKGQTVSRGDVLASSGMSKVSNTPAVHFQVRKGSTPVDPTSYLRR